MRLTKTTKHFILEQTEKTTNPQNEHTIRYIVTARLIGAKCLLGPSAHFVSIVVKLMLLIIRAASPNSKYTATDIKPKKLILVVSNLKHIFINYN